MTQIKYRVLMGVTSVLLLAMIAAPLTHLQQLGRCGGSEARRNPPFLGRRS